MRCDVVWCALQGTELKASPSSFFFHWQTHIGLLLSFHLASVLVVFDANATCHVVCRVSFPDNTVLLFTQPPRFGMCDLIFLSLLLVATL